MKNSITIVIVLFSFVLNAQSEIIFNKKISSIRVATGIEVELINNAEQDRIEADEDVLEAINFKIKNGELKLNLPIGKLIEGDIPLSIKVFTKNIEKITAVQGSVVEIQSVIHTSEFSIRATEGAFVSGEFDTASLALKAVSGAVIDIRGKTKNLDILANTGGVYKGKDLKTENTLVKVTYGGTASVYASESCDAEVVVGGTINIYGNPKFMNKKTNFGGDIMLFNP